MNKVYVVPHYFMKHTRTKISLIKKGLEGMQYRDTTTFHEGYVIFGMDNKRQLSTPKINK